MVKTRSNKEYEVAEILKSINEANKTSKEISEALKDENKEMKDDTKENAIIEGNKSVLQKEATKKPLNDEEKVVLPVIPRGKPKSGKIWKTPKERFSTIKKTKGQHKTFAEREALRACLKAVRETSRAIQDELKAKKEANKERRRINIKRTEENRLKSEIVQVISNSAKIKRMKKKQLRFIEKRNTTVVSK